MTLTVYDENDNKITAKRHISYFVDENDVASSAWLASSIDFENLIESICKTTNGYQAVESAFNRAKEPRRWVRMFDGICKIGLQALGFMFFWLVIQNTAQYVFNIISG